MKQITAIVNKYDADEVQSALVKKGYYITKISSTGGFLRAGSCTFLTVVEDAEVDAVIELVSEHCKKRRQLVPSITPLEYTAQLQPPAPVEVTVGGATVIVSPVDRFIKL